jgi:hypothetical protein
MFNLLVRQGGCISWMAISQVNNKPKASINGVVVVALQQQSAKLIGKLIQFAFKGQF